MSVGGSSTGDTPIDEAVKNAIAAGLHIVVAAGNSNVDAATISPAHVIGANTVGAIDDSNAKYTLSNYGCKHNLTIAPGVNITSAWIGSPDATATHSRTSAAAPYVASILTIALGKYGQVTPESLSASLKSHGQPIVTGMPANTTNLKAILW
ncbi:subtilisin-like serine protease [Ceratobasidium sp. 395]|nr:subtilisin-like serine protease [Ceratobasidium sp. 395]